VAADERFMQSIDRNARHETREEEPGDANPDRKCARERLPRHDIAITNCEAGDEGEIDGERDLVVASSWKSARGRRCSRSGNEREDACTKAFGRRVELHGNTSATAARSGSSLPR